MEAENHTEEAGWKRKYEGWFEQGRCAFLIKEDFSY